MLTQLEELWNYAQSISNDEMTQIQSHQSLKNYPKNRIRVRFNGFSSQFLPIPINNSYSKIKSNKKTPQLLVLR